MGSDSNYDADLVDWTLGESDFLALLELPFCPRRSQRVIKNQNKKTQHLIESGSSIYVTFYGRLPAYGCVTGKYALTKEGDLALVCEDKDGLPETSTLALRFDDVDLSPRVYEQNSLLNAGISLDPNDVPSDGDHFTPSLDAFPSPDSVQLPPLRI